MKFIIALSLILSGCATYQPAVQHFEDPQGRARSQVVLDQARCGSFNGQVEAKYNELYEACMDKLGYKMVTDKPATSTTSYNPLAW